MPNIIVLACLISLAKPDGLGTLPRTCEWMPLNYCEAIAARWNAKPEFAVAITCEGDYEKEGRK